MSLHLLTPDEVTAIEAEHQGGLSSRQVIEIFQALGVKLSEATFRKYVQLGVVPGCTHRVGQKGKHKGSRGVYPVSVVRRVNLIKKMMHEGMTLDDIRNSFVAFRNDLDTLQTALDALFRDYEHRLAGREFQPGRKRDVARQFRESQKTAAALVRNLERIGSVIAAQPLSSDGASGSR